MKTFVLFAVFFFVSLSIGSDEETDPIDVSPCYIDFKIDPNEYFHYDLLSTDENMHCFVKCILEEDGTIDKEGFFISSKLEGLFDEVTDEQKAQISQCQQEKRNEHSLDCSFVYKSGQCLIELLNVDTEEVN